MRRPLQKGAQKLLGDVLRKVPLTGVSEIRVPSDVRRILVQNIENLRESALDIFAKEISNLLAKIDMQHIVEDVLQNYTMRIEARIDLIPKSPKGAKAESGPRKGKK
jgi:hypothetical protein